NVFPWIAADANGHVAIAWYGADVAGNSNIVSATNTHWNVFVAESVNGHAISPVFAMSQATDHSNHTGQISTGGLLGSSDRSLADFFQIGIDPNHLVNIAYADNHAGTSVTYFTRERTATSSIATGGTGVVQYYPQRHLQQQRQSARRNHHGLLAGTPHNGGDTDAQSVSPLGNPRKRLSLSIFIFDWWHSHRPAVSS